MSGYSGTPLEKKLGFKHGQTVVVFGATDEYVSWLQALPLELNVVRELKGPVVFAHVFEKSRENLRSSIEQMRDNLKPDGTLWISWPKKSSKVATDITEDVVREIALPMALVDVKVCAVDEIWSGLKLVLRKSARGA